MIVTTTHKIENRSIVEYLGLVAGECILDEQSAQKFLTGLTEESSESYAEYKNKMTGCRLAIIEQMKTKAGKMGADAIVAIDFNYVVIKGDMLMIAAIGTAVELAQAAVSM